MLWCDGPGSSLCGARNPVAARSLGHCETADVAETVNSIAAVFDAAGADVFLHVCDVDSGTEVGVAADAPVVLASVFKIPVLVELARQVGDGKLAWTDRVHVPASRRTTGPTGLSVMLDDADLSLRDLAFWMMSVSDNTATDVVMELLGGAGPITATMAGLGLADTDLIGDCEHLLTDLAAQLGITDEALGWSDVDVDVLRACSGAAARRYQPLQPSGHDVAPRAHLA